MQIPITRENIICETTKNNVSGHLGECVLGVVVSLNESLIMRLTFCRTKQTVRYVKWRVGNMGPFSVYLDSLVIEGLAAPPY